MKQKTFFSLLMIAVLFSFSATILASSNGNPSSLNGETNTLLGAYTISELEPETIEGETLRKFELTYENGKAPVFIYLCEKSRCKEYIVRSNTMEVKYSCRKSGFGAEILYGKLAMYSSEANAHFISQDALDQQKKITTTEIETEKALGLIACYYPALFKNINLL